MFQHVGRPAFCVKDDTHHAARSDNGPKLAGTVVFELSQENRLGGTKVDRKSHEKRIFEGAAADDGPRGDGTGG